MIFFSNKKKQYFFSVQVFFATTSFFEYMNIFSNKNFQYFCMIFLTAVEWSGKAKNEG